MAGIGLDVSNGDEGFRIRVTQKHLAMPSSPLIKVILSPISNRVFMEPRKTHLGIVLPFEASIGGEII